MIFITVGSQKFQFNRLLKKVDELLEAQVIREPVFAQIGYSDYKPVHFPYKDFLNKDEMNGYLNQADLVLTHGGTASIIESVNLGKKVVAVSRLAKYGEHVDDHQTEIIRKFVHDGIIEGVFEMEELEGALRACRQKSYSPYISERENVISYLRQIITDCK